MPLVQRQADSGKITVSASEPATPLKGDLWYDTGDTELFSYNGSAFVGIGHAANETQTLTNKTIAFGSNTLTNVAKLASPVFTGNLTLPGVVAGLGVGKLELLFNNTLSEDGNGATFTPSSALDMKTSGKYSAFIVTVMGTMRVATDIGLKINGHTDYDYSLILNDSTTVSGLNVTTAGSYEMLAIELGSNGEFIYCSAIIRPLFFETSSGMKFCFESQGGTAIQGNQVGNGVDVTTVTDGELDSIQIIASNATGINEDAEINIYGVLR